MKLLYRFISFLFLFCFCFSSLGHTERKTLSPLRHTHRVVHERKLISHSQNRRQSIAQPKKNLIPRPIVRRSAASLYQRPQRVAIQRRQPPKAGVARRTVVQPPARTMASRRPHPRAAIAKRNTVPLNQRPQRIAIQRRQPAVIKRTVVPVRQTPPRAALRRPSPPVTTIAKRSPTPLRRAPQRTIVRKQAPRPVAVPSTQISQSAPLPTKPRTLLPNLPQTTIIPANIPSPVLSTPVARSLPIISQPQPKPEPSRVTSVAVAPAMPIATPTRTMPSRIQKRPNTTPLTSSRYEIFPTHIDFHDHLSRHHISEPTHISLLNSYNRRNARLAELDSLYSQNLFGQGQKVAPIEYADWEEMTDVRNGLKGNLSPKMRSVYVNNFSSTCPSRGMNNHHCRYRFQNRYRHDHGSLVSSIVMDFAPQAKTNLVGLFKCGCHDFSLADSLNHLAEQNDVSIINMSTWPFYPSFARLRDGQYSPEFEEIVEAFRRVARAGKAIVIAGSNEGLAYSHPQFDYWNYGRPAASWQDDIVNAFLVKLMTRLDSETRKSIIIAGNLDPVTQRAATSSNKPGSVQEVQDRFLFAPGKFQAYSDRVVGGTSFAAPFICAALACLLSKSTTITPKKAVKALLDSAEVQPDRWTYGRGIMRARRALSLLEDPYYY